MTYTREENINKHWLFKKGKEGLVLDSPASVHENLGTGALT